VIRVVREQRAAMSARANAFLSVSHADHQPTDWNDLAQFADTFGSAGVVTPA